MKSFKKRFVKAIAIMMFLQTFTVGFLGTGKANAGIAISDLFFSEYIEGSSNNKALGIYNPTQTSVNLATTGYTVKMYMNGNPSAEITINLDGDLAGRSEFVLAHSGANAAILAQADQSVGGGWYNGNDAVALYRGTTLVDVIGQIGTNPGTEWGTGLTSTADNTLVRKCSVSSGDTNGSDVFDPATQWDGYAVDTTTYLGSHNLCWPDADTDGVFDVDDNCPTVANADQLDSDVNGIGDACEVLDVIVEGPADGLITNDPDQTFTATTNVVSDSCKLQLGGGDYYTEMLVPNELSTTYGDYVISGDDTATSYALPFSFPFYGSQYNTVYVSTKGLLNFGYNDNSLGNNDSALFSRNAIAGLWDDIVTTVYVDASSEQVRFYWTGYRWSSGGNLTFEIVLHSNGRIDLNYGDVDLVGNTATIGLSAGNGTDYTLSSYNNSSIMYFPQTARFYGYIEMETLDNINYSVNINPLGDGIYHYNILCERGGEQAISEDRTLTIDTVVPSEIADLITTAGTEEIILSWTNPTEEDFAGANIYRATDPDKLGAKIGTVLSENIYIDEDVAEGTTYYYTVKAFDLAGNESVGEIVSTKLLLSTVVIPTTPVVTPIVKVENVTLVAGPYVYDEGEVKSDTTEETISTTTTTKPAEDEAQTKEKKNIPLWGIIFLIVLAGIGGYLFYTQSPEQETAGKKTAKKKKK